MIPKTPSGTESNNSIRLLDGTDGIPAAGDPIVVLCPAPGAKGQIGATKDLIDYLLIGANPPLGLRPTPQPGPLHLTRRSDLLDLELAPANLSLYDHP